MQKTKDNRGLTLIELIVVIAIMAVVMGMGLIGLNLIASGNVRSCANELKTSIGHVRITTMGKTNTSLKIYQGTDGYYKQEIVTQGDGTITNEEPIKIGKSTVGLTYETKDGTSGTIDSTGIVFTFNRENGKEATPYYNLITVTGGGYTSKVVIVPATGKVYLE